MPHVILQSPCNGRIILPFTLTLAILLALTDRKLANVNRAEAWDPLNDRGGPCTRPSPGGHIPASLLAQEARETREEQTSCSLEPSAASVSRLPSKPQICERQRTVLSR